MQSSSNTEARILGGRRYLVCRWTHTPQGGPLLVLQCYTKLRRLHLDHVQIIGDLPGLLLNCSILEDLELIACSGVADLNIPHQLAKLRHLLISNMCVHKVDFHVTGLTHFGYKGDVIPIVLHGCTKLEKVTLTFQMPLHEQVSNKGLGHAITGIPSISAVKELNIRAYMQEDQPIWSSQVHI
ncbi:hypothetical protein SEVIR_3G405550v4 [Setaria viridis]